MTPRNHLILPGDASRLSPVIRSLRLTTDEVQFGRVLAAICQEDPAVAAQFTSDVIKHAKGGHRAARSKARATAGDVRCVDEHRLEARVSRRSLRQRAKGHGRVDLAFTGSNDWQLLVELKLGAGFGDHQIERYAHERLVAVIVRDAKTDAVASLRGRPNFVGAATWSALLDDLRGLPVDKRWRDEWLGLLDVMHRDGDFDPEPPDGLPEVVEARRRLIDAAPDVLAAFCSDLERRYGTEAQVAVGRLRATMPYGKRGPWAGFGLTTRGDGPWLFFEIRDLWSPAPRLRLWHWHWPERRAKAAARAAYGRLDSKPGFRQLPEGAVFEETIGALENADAKRLAAVIADRVTRLVDASAFDEDIRYQQRHYSRR